MHEELTRSWKAPFPARNKSCGSSPLTSLDGGATFGYTGIPSVERSGAMQLCPTAASTLRCEHCLPSQASKYSSGLTGSVYRACGEAASALHAMALLQVNQAKAVRDLHKGGHDLAVLHELHAAMDLALRVTKVTAHSLGRAMSTLVVQELGVCDAYRLCNGCMPVRAVCKPHSPDLKRGALATDARGCSLWRSLLERPPPAPESRVRDPLGELVRTRVGGVTSAILS